MTTAAAAGWRDTLAEVERSIADCLSALDRYESAFGQVLGAAVPVAVPEPPAEGGLPAMDEKLSAARHQADEVERLLSEQEAVWGRWRDALAGWQQTLAADRPAGY